MIIQKGDDTHIRQNGITVTSYHSEKHKTVQTHSGPKPIFRNGSYVLPTTVQNSRNAELEDEWQEHVLSMPWVRGEKAAGI